MSTKVDSQKWFNRKLIIWYEAHKRELPWRSTKDPYKIWLSEIILQQTRVAQGLSYYNKFKLNYPTVDELANASEEQVLKDWQGLGYYSRARNLHAAAKKVSHEQNGSFPNSFEEIKKLKGVGDYTAAAIASFAYNLPHAVVDGNVYRLLSRVFGIETPIDSNKGKKEFQELADLLLDKKKPSDHNQAIMEFGSMQCKPKSPNCSQCPMQDNCIAFKTNSIDKFPVKEKKIKQRNRFLNYLIFENNEEVLVNQRTQKGIWQNLYDFPLIESSKELNGKELMKLGEFKSMIESETVSIQAESHSIKHQLSHQSLHAKFFHLRLADIKKEQLNGYDLISLERLKQLPIPKLIENYLNEETNLLSLFGS